MYNFILLIDNTDRKDNNTERKYRNAERKDNNTERKDNSDNIVIDIDECPICLSSIDDFKPYINLNCCNNNVHIQCLQDWYSIKKDNYCFLCSRRDDLFNDFIINTINHSNNNNEPIYINISTFLFCYSFLLFFFFFYFIKNI